MKKIALWSGFILGVCALCLTLWYLSAGSSQEKHLEKRLNISLPEGVNIVCGDDHGGFHGDGTLIAIVSFPDQASLDTVWGETENENGWNDLPVPESIIEPIRQHWEEYGGVLAPLPETEDGRWFYRDRYKEQYGETCEFNPVLQNCTFGLLDRESGRLYVLESDC